MLARARAPFAVLYLRCWHFRFQIDFVVTQFHFRFLAVLHLAADTSQHPCDSQASLATFLNSSPACQKQGTYTDLHNQSNRSSCIEFQPHASAKQPVSVQNPGLDTFLCG